MAWNERAAAWMSRPNSSHTRLSIGCHGCASGCHGSPCCLAGPTSATAPPGGSSPSSSTSTDRRSIQWKDRPITT
ncbi:hypothetical protein ACNF49_05115 [Actinomadura sp. ATCC 39365]